MFVLPSPVTAEDEVGCYLARFTRRVLGFGESGRGASAGGHHALYLYRFRPRIGEFESRYDRLVFGRCIE